MVQIRIDLTNLDYILNPQHQNEFKAGLPKRLKPDNGLASRVVILHIRVFGGDLQQDFFYLARFGVVRYAYIDSVSEIAIGFCHIYYILRCKGIVWNNNDYVVDYVVELGGTQTNISDNTVIAIEIHHVSHFEPLVKQ